jgi:hypothetical protein
MTISQINRAKRARASIAPPAPPADMSGVWPLLQAVSGETDRRLNEELKNRSDLDRHRATRMTTGDLWHWLCPGEPIPFADELEAMALRLGMVKLPD